MEHNMTGYPSIDKPWLAYYPRELFAERKHYNKIIDYIRDVWNGYDEDTMLHYYGSDVSAGDFFCNVDNAARSLKALGLEKGDTIICNLDSVPEFIYLFFACEIIGVNLKNKIGADAEEIAEVIRDSGAKYFFAHDFMDGNSVRLIYEVESLRNIIMVNPVEHFNGELGTLRPHIQSKIQSLYYDNSTHERNIKWSAFLDFGKDFTGEIYTESDENTKLFSAFTSGSTGDRKEVIHTSQTLLGMLDQMVFPAPKSEERETWLLPIFPPSLVAAIVAYICMPLVQGKTIVLDPYFDFNDLDLEVMHYRPNGTGLVPAFFEALIESKRIPTDYDMSFLKTLGAGAEAMPGKLVKKVEAFFNGHNCVAPLNGGWGNSEGGSAFTIAFNNDLFSMGSSGFPLINTVISAFKPGSEEELTYGEIGELCKAGPGIMLGYAAEEETAKTVKIHSDGTKWLHTGDFGYVTKEGLVFVLGREGIRTHWGKSVYPLVIENKVSNIDGVKTAIILSGDSTQYASCQAPYLFIVPEENADQKALKDQIGELLKSVLDKEEYPEKIYFIDHKPISHFKVDKKRLRKEYNIF